MKRLMILTAFLIVVSLMMTACVTMGYNQGNTARDIDVRHLANMVNDSLRRPVLKNKEIGILSFSNLNNLEEVEPLGRHLQERLSHALFDLGFRIVEIRMGNQIFFKPKTGELNLTRLKENLKRTEFKEIQSLVMGTYIDAGDYIYVRSQLIELDSSLIRASGEIRIRKGEYLHKLLKMEEKKKKTPFRKKAVYERFPSNIEPTTTKEKQK